MQTLISVRNAFTTRLQQKYLKNIGHFSVIDTGECPFCYADIASAVMLSFSTKVLLIAFTRTCINLRCINLTQPLQLLD